MRRITTFCRPSPSELHGLGRAITINSSAASHSPYIYRLFDYGPGVVNLSPGDNLSDYQWALKNEGRFRRVKSQLNLESLGGIYVHINETETWTPSALPQLEPGKLRQGNHQSRLRHGYKTSLPPGIFTPGLPPNGRRWWQSSTPASTRSIRTWRTPSGPTKMKFPETESTTMETATSMTSMDGFLL